MQCACVVRFAGLNGFIVKRSAHSLERWPCWLKSLCHCSYCLFADEVFFSFFFFGHIGPRSTPRANPTFGFRKAEHMLDGFSPFLAQYLSSTHHLLGVITCEVSRGQQDPIFGGHRVVE